MSGSGAVVEVPPPEGGTPRRGRGAGRPRSRGKFGADGRPWAREVQGLVQELWPFAAIVGAFVAAGGAVGIGVGGSLFDVPGLFWLALAYAAAAAALVRLWRTLAAGRRGPEAAVLDPQFLIARLGGGLVVTVLYVVLLRTFLHWKAHIPLFNPYAWDPALARLDRLVHFGRDPWELLHAFLGTPVATRALDTVYVSWFVVLTAVVLWQAITPEREVRRRFFLALALSWILVGIGLGTVLASVGPCFYGLVTGDTARFEALLANLDAVNARIPIQSVAMQRALWESYQSGSLSGVGGIAAMPSLHVGLSVLFAAAAFATHRGIGWALAGYAVLVQLATVHLGWHYAIDGYVAAASVSAIWLATRYIGPRRSAGSTR